MWTRYCAVVVLAHLGCLPVMAAETDAGQWGPFVGTVIDDATSQPVPGAVCVAIWMEDVFRLADTHSKYRNSRFAVADARGRFDIVKEPAPFLFPQVVNPVILDCVAPGYAPWFSRGPKDQMLEARLRPIDRIEQKHLKGQDPNIGVIPFARCGEMEKEVNVQREELGLKPMEFCGSCGLKRDAR